MLMPEVAPMTPMVQAEPLRRLIGLAQTVEMIGSIKPVAQRVFPVGPRKAALRNFFQQHRAPARIAQVKRIARGFDGQIGAAYAYPIAADGQIGELRRRPPRADYGVRLLRSLLMQPPMGREPGMPDDVGSQRCQRQIGAVEAEHEVAAAPADAAQTPQSAARD